MKREIICATLNIELQDVVKLLKEGYVLDPVFKYNPLALKEGAIYHLVKYSEEETKQLEETEARAPGKFEEVEEMAMVNFEEVKDKVAAGFVVHEIYSKGAVMIKRKAEEVD